MRINEAAKRCSITKKAVQYYVEQGFVNPRVLENGYRDFSEQDVALLRQIVLYRKLGLSICEIKCVLKNQSEISVILHQRVLDAEREKLNRDFLKRILSGETIDSLEQEINQTGSNAILTKRLVELFPGYYGKLLSLNFARYLTGKIETEEQMAAFDRIIEFFDMVPDIELPDDLQEYVDTYMEEYSSEDGTEQLERIMKEKDRAIQNVDEFVKNNKEMLDEYIRLKRSEEYKKLPAVRLMEYMKQVCSTNGYYDVFIPAMRKLSPLYDSYYQQLLKANSEFIERYPEYSI